LRKIIQHCTNLKGINETINSKLGIAFLENLTKSIQRVLKVIKVNKVDGDKTMNCKPQLYF
jgi:hypothetical protein